MSRQQVAKTGRDRYYRGNCNRVKLRGMFLKDLTADLEDEDYWTCGVESRELSF